MEDSTQQSTPRNDFLFAHLKSLDAFDAFLDNCKLPLLMRLAKLDLGWRNEVTSYVRKKWNPSQCLSEYIDNVPLFWSTLARTDGILTGPVVRDLFRESKPSGVGLDVVVTAPYLHTIARFLLSEHYSPIEDGAQVPGAHREGFGLQSGRSATFRREVQRETGGPKGGNEQKCCVRVTVARFSVIAFILALPCSCDMNLISPYFAICLYPGGTLLRQVALAFRTSYEEMDEYTTTRIAECAAAGFKVHCKWVCQSEEIFPIRAARWVGDSFCWTIQLCDEGEQPLGLSRARAYSRNGWTSAVVGREAVEHRFDYVAEYGTSPPVVETRLSVEPPWRAFIAPSPSHVQYNIYARGLQRGGQ